MQAFKTNIMTKKLSYRVIHTIRDLQKLEDRWNGLLNWCPHHTVFQTWEWQFTWLETFQKEPYVILVFKGDEPVAILPFFRINLTVFHILRLIGAPDSDYLDLIIRKGFEEQVFRLFFLEIIHTERSMGIVELHSINETSPVFTFLHETPLNDFEMEYTEKICPYVRLPETWDHYMRSLSSSMRYLIRRKQRKLDRDFSVTADFARTRDAFENRMADFILQHQKRWISLQKPGAFAREKFKAFHQLVGERLFQKGWVKLYFLELNNRHVASYYLFHYKNSFFYYLSGFDPKYEKYSPGVVLMGKIIKDAIRDGRDEFDLMRGNTAYKFSWTSNKRINRTFILERKTAAVILYTLIVDISNKVSKITRRNLPKPITSIFKKSLLNRILNHFDPLFKD